MFTSHRLQLKRSCLLLLSLGLIVSGCGNTQTSVSQRASDPAPDVASDIPLRGGEEAEEQLLDLDIMAGSAQTVASDEDFPWRAWHTLVPGSAIQMVFSSGYKSTCTLGAVADGETDHGPQTVIITAGHCNNGEPNPVFTGPDEGHADQVVGSVEKTVLAEPDEDGNFWGDYAHIPTNAQVDNRIADTHPVTGVLSRSELTKDMEICKFGFRTGKTCGKLLSADDEFIDVGLTVLDGDSGAPAYAIAPDGTAKLVGILGGNPLNSDGEFAKGVTTFSLLEPILAQENLTLKPAAQPK